MADLRRRSTSRVLSNVLWLAYLSADTVAIFVLGHLAVHARGPGHELMLFWAPFVLLHLGGQDSITAFSKQDNELWTRHLLSLVTQTAVAGYVVSQSSWPDARLRAAMVLMFICGFFKYAGRTFCLFMASPVMLRFASTAHLSDTLSKLHDAQVKFEAGAWRMEHAKERFEVMFAGDRSLELILQGTLMVWKDDIMLVDSPVDDWEITVVADELPDMLKEFRNRPDRCIAYQYVAARLALSYQCLYTKAPLWFIVVVPFLSCDGFFIGPTVITLLLLYTFFQCILTLIALVLFASVQKEGHYSKADITVSYILFVGAIVLGLLPVFKPIISYARKPFLPETVKDCAGLSFLSCFQSGGWLTRKQWSEELAQYSMTKRYRTTLGDSGFFDLKSTPVTEDLKLLVLDRLLLLQTRREEWDFANFRGERALGKWVGNRHQVQEHERSGYAAPALHESLNSRVDFPTSVLIWHIATDICYFSGDKRTGMEPDDETKKNKKMSRELSHYIMYLVFKCDVMLTSNSRLVHQNTHEELTKCFPWVQQNEKETVMVMFQAMKEEATKKEEEEEQQGSMPPRVAQDNENEEPANKDAADATSSRIPERLKRMQEELYSSVLPRAHAVAQELIGIDNEADPWEVGTHLRGVAGDAFLHSASLRGVFPLRASQHRWGIHHACPLPHAFSRPFYAKAWCLIKYGTYALLQVTCNICHIGGCN